MDIDWRAELVVPPARFLGHSKHQRGEVVIGDTGLGLDVEDVKEHAPIALQAIAKAGVWRLTPCLARKAGFNDRVCHRERPL